MNWWQTLLTIVINIPVAYFIISLLIIEPLIERHKYKKAKKKWDKEHSDSVRIKCINCKYCKCSTNYIGHYPYGIPERIPIYCTALGRRISEDSSCLLPEPPEGLYTEKDKLYIWPSAHTKVYFSSHGNCYHSTDKCTSLRNARNIYSALSSYNRRPCPKCWKEVNGTLYPK